MNNEVIEKLKKVLALANRGGTPEEAETALAKAKELAIRYNINLASVDVSDTEKTKSSIEVKEDRELKTRSKYRQPYHSPIAQVLMDCFDVHIIWEKWRENNGIKVDNIVIIGEVVDVTICKEVFPWLEKVFPRTLSKAVSTGELTYSMADTNGCYQGLAAGIVSANKRAEQNLSSADAGKYAMVVRSKKDKVEELVEMLYPNLEDRKSRAKNISSYAYHHGLKEGQKIKLGQMGSGKGTRELGE